MKKKQVKYGIFYRSNGRITTTPYAGKTFTKHRLLTDDVLQNDLIWLQNRRLKSPLLILPVS